MDEKKSEDLLVVILGILIIVFTVFLIMEASLLSRIDNIVDCTGSEKQFYVIKDADGYNPLLFVSPVNTAGELRKALVQAQDLKDGESIEKVIFCKVK